MLCQVMHCVVYEGLVLIIYLLFLFQLGKCFNSCIWSARTWGSLSNRYEIYTTLYDFTHHWHLKARKIGGTKRQIMFNFINFMFTYLYYGRKHCYCINVTVFISHDEAHQSCILYRNIGLEKWKYAKHITKPELEL